MSASARHARTRGRAARRVARFLTGLAGLIAFNVITFVCVYTLFGSAFLIFTLRLIRRGPSGLPGHALPAGSLKRALRPAVGGVREHLASRK
jgi:hypothetical protein